MKILISVLIMSTLFLTSQDTKLELFLLKPEYKIIKSGQLYQFDSYNMKILIAKHKVIKDLFIPATNCIYSNLIINNEILEGNLYLAETKLKK